MTVFVVDGFQISQDSSVMADNNNNKDDSPFLADTAHWRLETSLPETRLEPGLVEADRLKPVPPPKPANISMKLLEYKLGRGGPSAEEKSGSESVNKTTTVKISERDPPDKLGHQSRPPSRIPIFKGRRQGRVDSDNSGHKVCLRIGNIKEEEDTQRDTGLTTPSRAGSCSGRATPASLIPRPCRSLSVSLLSLSGDTQEVELLSSV